MSRQASRREVFWPYTQSLFLFFLWRLLDMYLCYIDESGTSQIPGNTSHYILAGLAIPAKYWKKCDGDIFLLKRKWNLGETEINTAWMLRYYKYN